MRYHLHGMDGRIGVFNSEWRDDEKLRDASCPWGPTAGVRLRVAFLVIASIFSSISSHIPLGLRVAGFRFVVEDCGEFIE